MSVTNGELDKITVGIIQAAGSAMTLPQIERVVAEKGIDADTFDVQRSVRRLIQSGQAELTDRFAILDPNTETLAHHLDAVLKAWAWEANQGDGIDEDHIGVYEAARQELCAIRGWGYAPSKWAK